MQSSYVMNNPFKCRCPGSYCRAYGGPHIVINTLRQMSKEKEDEVISKHRNNNYNKRTVAGVMAASLVIDCKFDASIGNELLNSPNIMKQMIEYILSKSSKNSIDFIAVCYINCILYLLNTSRFGSRIIQDGGVKVDRINFNDFVLNSCIYKQGIVHGLIILLHDIVSHGDVKQSGNKDQPFLKPTEDHPNTTYCLTSLLIKGLRIFFVLSQQLSSKSTLIQLFRRIPIKKLVRTITLVISLSSKESVIYSQSFMAQIYGLFGDLLSIIKNTRILEIEEILFEAIISENFIPTLMKVQASTTGKGTKIDVSSTTITVIIELILSSKMMSKCLTQEQYHDCPILNSVVESILAELQRNCTSERHHLRQWTSIYACLCNLFNKRNLSLNSLTNLKEVRMQTKMKKRSIYKQDIMNMILQDNLIIPFTWGLVHSNKSVKSNAVKILIFLTQDVGCLFHHEGCLMYLLKRGYAQILYAVREKCRIKHSNEAIILVGKLLIGMRSKLLTKIAILKKKKHFHSCLELFNFICSSMKVKKCKLFIFKEFFILYTDMIFTARENIHTTCGMSNLSSIDFFRDRGEDIFLYLQQTTRMLRYVVSDTKSVSSHHEIWKHNLEGNDTFHKMVFANVFCKDKGVTVMMECATLKKLISNAPILAQKAIEESSFHQKLDHILILNLNVFSYDVFEEYMCNIDVGIQHHKHEMMHKFDVDFCLLLTKLAHSFGSKHLIPDYFDIICLMMNPSNCINIFEMALEVSFIDGAIATLEFVSNNFKIFVESFKFLSKQRSLENFINKVIFFRGR